MKGKFIYVFADGSKMTDRNGYKTLSAAKKWAKDHNKIALKKDRVVSVLVRIK